LLFVEGKQLSAVLLLARLRHYTPKIKGKGGVLTEEKKIFSSQEAKLMFCLRGF
jgi:hypothetical protein